MPIGTEFFLAIQLAAGNTSAILRWTAAVPAVSWIEFGTTTDLGFASAPLGPHTEHSCLLAGLSPGTEYFFQLVAEVDGQPTRSLLHTFRTAGEWILDNPAASYAGNWSLGTSASDKYGTNYHYAGTVTGDPTASATFEPNLFTPGRYDLYVWYPQGSNRSARAPFLIHDRNGTVTLPINQTTGGGGWRLLASDRSFGAGTEGFVRLLNNTGETNRVVLADAIRLVYASHQDPPPPGFVPEWWAQFYFGTTVDGRLDPDADGYSNHAEFVCGTEPDNPQSHLQLRIDSPAPDVRRAVFTPFHPGRVYRLERTEAVTPPIWTTLTDLAPTESGPGQATITDTSPATGPQFYRLRIELLP